MVHIEDIAYDVDGTRMVGHLAFDDGVDGRRPAVLLSHEGTGLDPHVKGRAERLAALGYVAFALDYFGDGVAPPVDQAMAKLGPLLGDPAQTRKLATAGLDVLLGQPQVDPDKVAAIGYCFGGAMSLELGRTGANLKAVVGFHPGFTGPNAEDDRQIQGSVLMCCGTDDPFAGPDQRLAFEGEMRDAGVADWRLELYGGVGHSFTNPAVDELAMPGIGYDAAADRRSWRSMLDLFDEVLPFG
jgi:dienelactone hydrolase